VKIVSTGNKELRLITWKLKESCHQVNQE